MITCHDASIIVFCMLPNVKGSISNCCCNPVVIKMVKCLGMDGPAVHKPCKAGDPDPAMSHTRAMEE